jgi:hypothetical protein
VWTFWLFWETVAIVAQSWNDTKKLVVLEMVVLELVVVLRPEALGSKSDSSRLQKPRTIGHAQPVLWIRAPDLFQALIRDCLGPALDSVRDRSETEHYHRS